jgi:3-oxoadipate enol-lactonase
MQRQTFTTPDGCPISYALTASPGAAAPRIALVHSLALGDQLWQEVVPILAQKAQVLTLDCRGHGRSGRPHGAYTTGQFAGDLAGLFDAVGWADAAVAGCSMGGCVALAFAAHHPQRLRALGLIDTTAWYGENAPTQWRERGEAGRTKGLASLVDFQMTRWFGDAFRNGNPAAVRELVELFCANDPECYAATCEMLGTADLRWALSGIKVPTAVAVGEDDYATPVAMASAMHEAIAGSTLDVLAGGRHLTPREKPQEIATILAGLLGRVDWKA